MSARNNFTARTAAVATGIAAACAIGMSLLLETVGGSSDLKERTAALEGSARKAQDLLGGARAGTDYGPGAICTRAAFDEAGALRESVSGFAAQTNLKLDTIDARPEALTGEAGVLTPVRLRFAATGSYENVVMLLAALSRQRPDIFVDTLDMTAKTANVTVSFSGRVFCSA